MSSELNSSPSGVVTFIVFVRRGVICDVSGSGTTTFSIPTLPGDSRLLGRTENYKSAVPGTSKTHPSGPDHFSSYLEPHRTWFCFRFVALQAGLEFVTSVDGVGIDFALSLLTLQHMIPQLQIAVIEHLCDALAPSGLGFIQLLTGLDTSALVTSASKPS